MRKTILFLFLLSAVSFLFSQNPTIVYNNGQKISNVEIVAVGDSKLIIKLNNKTQSLSLASIEKVLFTRRGSYSTIGAIIGGIAGATTGVQINRYEGGTEDVRYGLYGFGTGAFIGAVLGDIFVKQNDVSYSLSDLSVREKKKVFSAILNKPSDIFIDTVQTPSDNQFCFFVSTGIAFPIRTFADNSLSPSSGRAQAGLHLHSRMMYLLTEEFAATAGLEYMRNEINVSKYGNNAFFHSITAWTVTIPSVGATYFVRPDEKNIFLLNGAVGAAIVTSPKLEANIGGAYFLRTSAQTTAVSFSAGAGWLLQQHYSIGLHYHYALPRFSVQETNGTIMRRRTFYSEVEILSVTLGYYF